MDEQHNELMKYVLDEPEQAAREIAQLRKLKADLLQALKDVAENTVSIEMRNKVYAAIDKAK